MLVPSKAVHGALITCHIRSVGDTPMHAGSQDKTTHFFLFFTFFLFAYILPFAPPPPPPTPANLPLLPPPTLGKQRTDIYCWPSEEKTTGPDRVMNDKIFARSSLRPQKSARDLLSSRLKLVSMRQSTFINDPVKEKCEKVHTWLQKDRRTNSCTRLSNR